jgi:hypothetical protein
MGQQKASLLRIGQLIRLNGGTPDSIRFAEVCRQEKWGNTHVNTWVKVVKAPEEDLVGAETTIDGCETFQGVGWYCVSSMVELPTFEDLS